MPSQSAHQLKPNDKYNHIYNCGVEKRIIFGDAADFETFQGYLKDYLSPRPDKKQVKTQFTVNGKTYHGVPHQPKNYSGHIELVAYSLQPTHFHLVVRELTPSSLTGLLKSLSTRYSIYFNAKYERTGKLFDGSYKSARLQTRDELLLLTHYLHHEGGYSSAEDFLGVRTTSWVKPDAVLAAYTTPKEYEQAARLALGEREQQVLERIILEREPDYRSSQAARNDASRPASRSRAPEFIAFSTVFALLFTLGMRNIQATPNTATPIAMAHVLGAESTPAPDAPSPTPTPTAPPTPKPMIQVTHDDQIASVNIRELPTTTAPIIQKAKHGDTFEWVAKSEGWYEVTLASGSRAYISETYARAIDND